MLKFLSSIAISILLVGCSAYKASNQPDKKDLSVLSAGTPRVQVIGELGAPATSEYKGKDRVDIFSFKQGYHVANKSARAVGHASATVLTLGLWEVLGTPIEGGFDGSDVNAQVTYDANDNVKEVAVYKDGKRIQAN